MKYMTARQCWFDAFNDTLSPDLREAILNLPRGTAHDSDSKKWHNMMAGKIQNAVAALPKHLQDWGMLAFAPDHFRTIEQFNRVQDELWRQFKETRTYEKNAQDSIGMMILCRLSITQQVHREQSGREYFTQAYCMGKIGKGKNEWERHGWKVYWEVLNDLLADWTGWALKPVVEVMRDFETKRALADE